MTMKCNFKYTIRNGKTVYCALKNCNGIDQCDDNECMFAKEEKQ